MKKMGGSEQGGWSLPGDTQQLQGSWGGKTLSNRKGEL